MYKKIEGKEVVFPELSYKIIGCAYEVYNQLGSGFHEKYYQKALSVEFKIRKLSFSEQFYYPAEFKNEIIGRNYFDFLVEKEIIVEIKRGNQFSKQHFDQVSRYLKVSGRKLGILICFSNDGVKFKRVLNIR